MFASSYPVMCVVAGK